MTDIALPILAIALNYLALSSLALSQNRHWRAAMAPSPGPAQGQRLALRCLGYGCLCTTLLLFVVSNGTSFGVLLWILVQAPLAMAVAFTLSWRVQVLKALSRLLPTEAFVGRPKVKLHGRQRRVLE